MAPLHGDARGCRVDRPCPATRRGGGGVTAAALLRREGTTASGRSFCIRPSADGDVPALVAMFDQVAAEGRWLQAAPGSRSVLEEELALDLLLREGGLSLSLEVAGEVCGRATVVRQSGGAEVGLAIAAAVRGEGLGRALLEVCIDWARAVRLDRLWLRVVPGNEPALGLYRSLGFAGERTVVGTAGAPLLQLELRI